jgi:hypothetical protein
VQIGIDSLPGFLYNYRKQSKIVTFHRVEDTKALVELQFESEPKTDNSMKNRANSNSSTPKMGENSKEGAKMADPKANFIPSSHHYYDSNSYSSYFQGKTTFFILLVFEI